MPPNSSQPPDANALLAAFYARGLIDYLQGRGIDAATLVAEVPIARPEAMAISPEISLTEWVRLLERAAQALGEPDLPAKAGESLQVRHLGVLGHVLMNCRDLHDAYRQLARYIRLLGQIGQPVLTVKDAEAHLLWQWPYPSPPPQSVALFMLAARARFMRWLTDRHDLRMDAHFHGPAPGPLEGFVRVFGGRVQFGQPESKLIFPADYLKLPVVTADEEFRRQAEQRAQEQLQKLTKEPELVRQIKSVLILHMASGRVHLEETARSLHLSARTLQRRLAEIDAHYQQILDEVRAESARQLLRDPSIPLTQIAFLLGYSDQSTFNTAYRRWFGTSPGQTRRQSHAQAS
ncbi:MAG TPA: AraC family transcriptional regulator [Nevskiales bacterium]|nr:AraC family transcriptional regulator [Nevskiales bacterium]